jgi:hypothetical protein
VLSGARSDLSARESVAGLSQQGPIGRVLMPARLMRWLHHAHPHIQQASSSTVGVSGASCACMRKAGILLPASCTQAARA